MRVAFLLHGFPIVSETFILNQIVGLLDRGCDVDIYARRRWPNSPIHPDIEAYRLFDRTRYLPDLPESHLRRLRAAVGILVRSRRIRQAFRSIDIARHGRHAASLRFLFECAPFLGRGDFTYDVIHVHFGFNAPWAIRLKTIGAIRGNLVVSFHGYDVNVWPNRVGSSCYDEVFQVAKKLFVSSYFIKRKLIELGADAKKISRLPVGVNPELFVPRGRSERTNNMLVFCTVARLVEVKGVAYALRAFAKVHSRFSNSRYIVVGEGPLLNELLEITNKLGIGHSVSFLGALTAGEVAEILGQVDLFVFPSVVGEDGAEEAQGLALLEAQCAGIPVIGTSIGGIPESMVHGLTGALVPARCPEELARVMLQMAANPEARRRMGEVARNFVIKEFNLGRLNDLLVETYRQIAK